MSSQFLDVHKTPSFYAVWSFEVFVRVIKVMGLISTFILKLSSKFSTFSIKPIKIFKIQGFWIAKQLNQLHQSVQKERDRAEHNA